MKCKRHIHFIIAAIWAFAINMPGVTSAQTMEYAMPSPPSSDASSGRPPLFDVSVESSYAAAAGTKFRGATLDDSDAFNFSLGLSTRVPINERWIVPLDLRSQNFELGSVIGAPVPGDIHTLQFGTGLGYRPNDRWMFMARVNATLYKLRDVGANDVGFSGGVTAMWNYSPSLKVMFGVLVSPDSDIKVLPMAGLDWAINERLDLRLMFPKPRLVYKPNERLRLHVGADMNTVTFRTSDSFGTSIGLPQYNDALGTYRDIRFGVGGSYQIKKTLSLDADAGYSVNRRIHYTRIDESVTFDSAPYARIGLRVGF